MTTMQFKMTVTQLPHYCYLVDFHMDMIKGLFCGWFKTTVKERQMVFKKGQRPKSEMVEYDYPHYLADSNYHYHYRAEDDDLMYSETLLNTIQNLTSSQVVLLAGHYEYLRLWCQLHRNQLNLLETYNFEEGWEPDKLPPDHPERPPIERTWLERYLGHPRGKYYAEAQTGAVAKGLRNRHCALELGTGLGKTEVILGITDSLLNWDNFKGNIAILVPGNTIRDEIKSRAKIYQTNLNPDRIRIINPVGLMNSNVIKKNTDPQQLEWIENVTAVISDEAHKMCSDSYMRLFLKYMPNVRRSIALSGSLDKSRGQLLSPEACSPNRLPDTASRVVGLSGPCKIHRKVEVGTKLTTVKGEITPKEVYEKIKEREDDPKKAEVHMFEKLDALMLSPYLPPFIKWVWDDVLKDLKDKKLYIPFSTKETGLQLANAIRDQGFRVCYWAGDTVALNGVTVGTDISKVKALSEAGVYDILLTSKIAYEGADLKGLNAVLPLLGSSFSQIVQPIGRSARGKDLHIVLLEDIYNDFVSNQNEVRVRTVMREYTITEFERRNYVTQKNWEDSFK